MPRLALTVRLKTSEKTENTSVVAPPISTASTLNLLALANFSVMVPTAVGVGMMGAPTIFIRRG